MNVLITGIPRAGTSLAAAILDQAPNAFCFSEPARHVELMEISADQAQFVRRVWDDVEHTRSRLIAGETVRDRRFQDGRPVTNYFGPIDSNGKRAQTAYSEHPISRSGLSAKFVLGVKHNALYLAVLPQLVQAGQFMVVAVIRNPIDVISSWRSLDLPVSHGRLPAAERFWPEMRTLTGSNRDLLDKQIRIYDLICSRISECEPSVKVVRYEELLIQPDLLFSICGIPGGHVAIDVQAPRRTSDEVSLLSQRINELNRSGHLPGLRKYYAEPLSSLAPAQ